MRRLDVTLEGLRPSSMCMHNGRLFGFPETDAGFQVAEVVLAREIKVTVANSELVFAGESVICCSINDGILVMAGNEGGVSAALVAIDEGRFCEEAVHITRLAVSGEADWSPEPFLCQVSKNLALLCFKNLTSMWYCSITDVGLEMIPVSDCIPRFKGFCSPPHYLCDNCLLAIGSLSRSNSINLVSCNDTLEIDKVGSIPGFKRSAAATLVLKSRFVIGFGGFSDVPLGDMWVFDLETRKSSIVWEKGQWGASGTPFLALKGRVLLLIAEKVYAITVPALSELIENDWVRDDFCHALGLPTPQRCTLSPQKKVSIPAIVKIRGGLRGRPWKTVQCKERLFCVSYHKGFLEISELVFHGSRVKEIATTTSIMIPGKAIGCCALGERILVVSGDVYGNLLAALIAVDDDRPSEASVHITMLTVNGCFEDGDAFYLHQTSPSQVLVYLNSCSNMWYCDVTGSSLTVNELHVRMPTMRGFRTVPVGLPDRSLLVAGSYPESTDIIQIIPETTPRLERIGSISGLAREQAITTLLKDRFLVGFGGIRNGTRLEDFWIFDLETRNSSIVWKNEACPQDAFALYFKGDTLYVIGRTCYSFNLSALSRLIDDAGVREAFCESFGLPVLPTCAPSAANSVDPNELIEKYFKSQSFNTAQLGGRTFHIFSCEGRLAISEVVFDGPRIQEVTVRTQESLPPEDYLFCPLDDYVLIMFEEESGDGIFTIVISVDDGPLSETTTHVTHPTLSTSWKWDPKPTLYPLAWNQALLYIFSDYYTCWVYHCDITDTEIQAQQFWTENHPHRVLQIVPFDSERKSLITPVSGVNTYGGEQAKSDFDSDTSSDQSLENEEERQGRTEGEDSVIRNGQGRTECSNASAVFIGNRFLIGISDTNYPTQLLIHDCHQFQYELIDIPNLWVSGDRPILSFENDTLHVSGEHPHSFTLQRLSKYISDNDIWQGFCSTFNLTVAPECASSSLKENPLEMMMDYEGASCNPRNTIQHKGWVLHFSSYKGKLLISRFLLVGRVMRTIMAYTELCFQVDRINCCSLGDRVLVLGEKNENVSAVSVVVQEMEVHQQIVRVTKLSNPGYRKGLAQSYLCPLAKNQALLYFRGSRDIWCCNIVGRKLQVQKLYTQMPADKRFDFLPFLPQSGKALLVIYATNQLQLVTPLGIKQLNFKPIGSFPKTAGFPASIVLLKNRFLIGFSKCYNTLITSQWIFDLQLRKSSLMKRKEEWYSDDRRTFFAASNSNVYLLGDVACPISLLTLFQLIEDASIQSAFCKWMNLSVRTSNYFSTKMFIDYIPLCARLPSFGFWSPSTRRPMS